MFSYVFMKILESRPRRYDRGIRWLSLGRSERVKERIVREQVLPRNRVLEIGTGTGTLALLAARKGASVLAFDISAGMLTVAREKIRAAGLGERIELLEMGVAQMDGLPSETFDLVVSTLVFSEFSPDETRYALRQAHRLLRPGGRIALADETRPRGLFKRFIYHLVRTPLLLITYLLTQTATRAVSGLEARLEEAGFRVLQTNRSALDTFLYVVAGKGEAR